MSGLKIVALISGGKDSLFSLLHCLENGHDVVALANLYPAVPDDGSLVEDTDSFMYQTIGHAVIPLYEKALGLPLYRQEINGSAVNHSKSYGPNPSEAEKADETESLVPLLQKVMAAHPEVNAVSTGAILSDYQRTRVESVALRLGLTPLSYLWQYPHLPPGTQESLLEDMAAVGQDARIIKVASGGMDDTFLWQNVADCRTKSRLVKASQRFGNGGDGAALGEGGEYETLAVAGPAPLWKARIMIDEQDRMVLPGEAGSSSLKIAKAGLGPLEASETQTVRTPQLLDDRFAKLLGRLAIPPTADEVSQLVPISPATRSVSAKAKGVVLVKDVTAPGQNASQQTEAIMRELVLQLSDKGHDYTTIVYTSIILRDMADFAAVNAAYGRFFQRPNPPARVTLCCTDALPRNALVSISATSVSTSILKPVKGLHVQSRSYWAPANIGPYSQAITVPATSADGSETEVVYVAGQIPLEPASMELHNPHGADTPETFLHQAVLALQHLYRIGAAVGVRRWTNAIACFTDATGAAARDRAILVKRAWREMHLSKQSSAQDDEDEDEDFDVWDRQQGAGRTAWQTSAAEAADDGVDEAAAMPSINVYWVEGLPRGANVEWIAYGTTRVGEGSEIEIPHMAHLIKSFKRNEI